MAFDKKEIEKTIADVSEQIAYEGISNAREFWSGITGEQIDEARHALRRLAENNLAAVANPSESERYLQNAANNFNTLVNLAAGNKIAARSEAREMVKMAMNSIFDIAFAAIDAAL